MHCPACGSDYWPDFKAADYSGEHPAGDFDGTPGGAAKIARTILRVCGEYKSYAEVGCPRWGLLPHFQTPRVALFGGLVEASIDSALFGAPIRHILKRETWKARAAALAVRPLHTPARFALIPADPHYFWSDTCGCRSGIPLAAPQERFDVVSCINVLDHYPEPIALLNALRCRTTYLFIWTHSGGQLAPQHSVRFSRKGLIALAERAAFSVLYQSRERGNDFGMIFA